ncbi:hypothetical protein EDC04DRAFT_761286 [Pisolithus marmoratus]|nr:hypothetical protein EDC04DRAFT_761286 [Pisolithus marmoratus]
MFKMNCEPLSPELSKELCERSKTALSVLIPLLAFSSSKALQAATLGLLLYTVSLHALTCMGYFLGTSIFTCACLHAVPFMGICVIATIELVLLVRSPCVIFMVLVLCILPPFVGGLQRIWRIQGKASAAHLEGCGRTNRAVNTEV